MKHIVSIILAVAMVLPATAAAYTTTGQRAYEATDTTAIFTIEYAFGHEDYDLYLPALTTRGQSFGNGDTTLGYEIVQDDDFATANGTAYAAILSNVPIVDGMYKVPKGFKASFTLIVLYVTDTDTTPAAYAARVTDLPFSMENADERVEQRLNPSELQYYETEEISLNDTSMTNFLESVRVEVVDIEYTEVE